MRTDERASSRFVHQVEELREQLGREKERACAHERELARQRLMHLHVFFEQLVLIRCAGTRNRFNSTKPICRNCVSSTGMK